MTLLYERMQAAMAAQDAPGSDARSEHPIGTQAAAQQQGNGSLPGINPSAVQSGAVAPRTCTSCPATLGPRNRSGLCRPCFGRASKGNAASAANKSVAMRRYLATNPDKLDERRRRLAAVSASPAKREASRQRALKMDLSAIGRAHAFTPEACARRSASKSATQLRDIAPRHRDEHRELVRSGKLSAAQSREYFRAVEARETAAMRAGAGQ